MSLRRDRAVRFFPWVLLLALALAACGKNESATGHAEPGPPAEESNSLAYKDLSDFSASSLSLTTSAQYEADGNTVKLFTVVKDQDNTTIATLNQYNFVIGLNPASLRIIDPSIVTQSSEVADDRVVALVIDSSGSMEGALLAGAKSAAKKYVEQMSGTDEAAIVTFSDDARTVQGLTRDKTLLNSAIDSLTAGGATNFGTAITRAVEVVGTRPGKRAMIFLTDGDDTVDTVTGGPTVWFGNTSSSRNQGLEAAFLNEFRIYTVGLGTGLSDTGFADLNKFADYTGGTFFAAPTPDALDIPFSRTIPDEISALPPMETTVLSFPNPYTVKAGQKLTFAYEVSVTYENANGPLRATSSGTYQIP